MTRESGSRRARGIGGCCNSTSSYNIRSVGDRPVTHHSCLSITMEEDNCFVCEACFLVPRIPDDWIGLLLRLRQLAVVFRQFLHFSIMANNANKLTVGLGKLLIKL